MTHRQDTTVMSIYAPNNMAVTFIEQMPEEMPRDPGKTELSQLSAWRMPSWHCG